MTNSDNNNWFADSGMQPTRLLLTRHGETQWNAEHRIQGHTDMELNETGIRQAELLAERLADTEFSLIYSSDLSRASRTAGIIHKKIPGSRHIMTPLLRERNWGIFEGKKWKEIEEQLPEEIRQFRRHPVEFKPEGGESRAQVIDRIKNFHKLILGEHAGETIVVVTHGGVSSLMIKLMIGMDMGNITPFRIENCSVSIMDYVRKDTWFVQCLNDMSHLEDLKIV